MVVRVHSVDEVVLGHLGVALVLDGARYSPCKLLSMIELANWAAVVMKVYFRVHSSSDFLKQF